MQKHTYIMRRIGQFGLVGDHGLILTAWVPLNILVPKMVLYHWFPLYQYDVQKPPTHTEPDRERPFKK